jgi:peptidoglycan biosynthesis protein MviN/MurJ (putative lipid II flippase)
LTRLRKLAGDVSSATVGNLIGRSANVIIPLALVGTYGVNGQTDTFFLIFTIAFFFYGTLANAMSDVSVPLLISKRLFFSRIHILLIGTGGSLLILGVAGLWHLFLIKFSWKYAIALAVLSGAGMANGLASGLLLSKERFALPGITWALRLLPIAAFFLFHPSEKSLAWLAVAIGMADWLRLFILSSYVSSPAPKTLSSGFKSILSAFPAYGIVLGASAIVGLNPVIDRLIARISGTGAISVLETAERAYGILATLCTIGISSVLLTYFSKKANHGSIRRDWKKIVRFVIMLCSLWIFAGIALGHWGLSVYLDHFTPLSVAQSAMAKRTYWFYLAGLPVFVFVLVYVKRLQAVQQWWTMLISACLGVGLNIPVSLLFRKWLDVPGIALATSVIYLIILALLALVTHFRTEE